MHGVYEAAASGIQLFHYSEGDDSVISDDGESMNSRPTSDGGDTISREKVVNFNDVTAEGAAFVDILCPEGDSVDAQWPHESHVKFISENGGIGL